ncbi:MAG TPA: hypothetical protein VNM72_00740 [Blastocatellia bacterium]|nr:hypothetical protein [Blastocatellia bacterium]
MMDEREFYCEREEVKIAAYECPHCRVKADYRIRWIRRTKKKSLPSWAGEEDRQKFQKARDHMVRVDDVLTCRNERCRRRFDIPSLQTVVFL